MPTFRKNLHKQYIIRQSVPKWGVQNFPMKVQKEKLKLLLYINFNLKCKNPALPVLTVQTTNVPSLSLYAGCFHVQGALRLAWELHSTEGEHQCLQSLVSFRNTKTH